MKPKWIRVRPIGKLNLEDVCARLLPVLLWAGICHGTKPSQFHMSQSVNVQDGRFDLDNISSIEIKKEEIKTDLLE